MPPSRSLREEEPVEITEPSTKPKRGLSDLGEGPVADMRVVPGFAALQIDA